MGTAGSIMFLLGIGELLEEWTHKKSVGDLARSDVLECRQGLDVKRTGPGSPRIGDQDISAGDEVVVHMGTVIPFDGIVTAGEAMVNQASLTGESQSGHAREKAALFMQVQLLEEGEITVLVEECRRLQPL